MKKTTILVFAIFSCASLFAQRTVEFKNIVKLGEDINTEAEEIMPLVSHDGKDMFFVRANHKNNVGGAKTGHDIWHSNRKNPTLFENIHNKFKGLNNAGNNAVVGISKMDDRLFVLNAYKQETDKHHGIAESKKDGKKWTDPKYVEIPGMNSDSDFFGYFINPDETVMFISMHAPDAVGKEDLYVSSKNGNSWSTPVPLGKNINTSGFEMSPYLSHDETRLYFSSDGHGGQGSADIFFCERIGDDWTSWSDPVNLGNEVNSKAFDAYFVEGPDSVGYFASNRDAFHSDIYSITVSITEELVEEPIIEEPPVIEEPIVEEPVIKEEPKPLPIPEINNIYFDNNRFFIRDDAKPTLDKIVMAMKNDISLKITIHGHADNTHHASSNMTLSKNRAQESRKYLTKAGIDSSRITIESFGETKPVADCEDCSESQLQSNRRVEFKLSR